MPGMRFTEILALSVDSRVGISRSGPEIDDRLFFLPTIIGKKHSCYNNISVISFNIFLQ